MGAVINVLQQSGDVLLALSLPVKIAWGVWIAFGIALLVWERRSSSVPTTPIVHAARKSGVRPIAVPPPKKAPVAPYGSPDFLATLDQETGTNDHVS
jgi:hypothetical protein